MRIGFDVTGSAPAVLIFGNGHTGWRQFWLLYVCVAASHPEVLVCLLYDLWTTQAAKIFIICPADWELHSAHAPSSNHPLVPRSGKAGSTASELVILMVAIPSVFALGESCQSVTYPTLHSLCLLRHDQPNRYRTLLLATVPIP